MNIPPDWTDVRVDRLKELNDQGYSSAQIARELGGVSRSAVIGKLHRLGLQKSLPSNPHGVARSAKAALVEQSARSHTPTTGGHPWRNPGPPKAPKIPKAVQQEAVVLPKPANAQAQPKTIFDIGRCECRWALGKLFDPVSADTLFCAEPVTWHLTGDPSPFCAKHYKRAYDIKDGRRAKPQAPADANVAKAPPPEPEEPEELRGAA